MLPLLTTRAGNRIINIWPGIQVALVALLLLAQVGTVTATQWRGPAPSTNPWQRSYDRPVAPTYRPPTPPAEPASESDDELSEPREQAPSEHAPGEPAAAPRLAIPKPPAYLKSAQKSKLLPVRIPYLSELAIDVPSTLRQFVRSDPVRALETYKAALEWALATDNVKAQYQAHTDVAHVSYLTGRLTGAAEHYQRALSLSMGIADDPEKCSAMRRMGTVLIALAEYRSGENLCRQALKTCGGKDDSASAGMAWNNIGVLFKNRGKYVDAYGAYRTALDRLGDNKAVKLLVLKNLARLCAQWANYEDAERYYSEAKTAARTFGDVSEQGEILASLSHVLWEEGKHDKAQACLDEAVQTLESAGAPTDLVKKLMGDRLMDLGKTAEAKSYVKSAGFDSSLGRMFLASGRLDEAGKYYERVRSAAEKEGNLGESFAAYTGLGRVMELRGRLAEAQGYYARALKMTEQIRATLLMSERRNFFAEKIGGFFRSEPAKGLVRVALKRRRPQDSIYPAEMTRCREFADNLAQKTEGRHFGVPSEILVEEQRDHDRVAALRNARNVLPKEVDRDRFVELTVQVAAAEDSLKALVKRLREEYPDYASVRYPRPVKLEDSAIKANEYVLMLDVLGDSVSGRLIKGHKIVRAYTKPYQSKDLDRDIAQFRKNFERVRLRDYSVRASRTLRRNLLDEALKAVPAGTPITIIPDGNLALLPFEALVLSGSPTWKKNRWGRYPTDLTYVADRYPIVYYQSLTAMKVVRGLKANKPAGRKIVVMADPVLGLSDARAPRGSVAATTGRDNRTIYLMGRSPGKSVVELFRFRRLQETAWLAQEIQKRYPDAVQVYTGLRCTKKALLDLASHRTGPYKSMVIATHGVAANRISGIMEPFLAFTLVPNEADGLLTMSEVAGLKLDADVAALVACQTGLGNELAGEGVMSMGRAFQCAGVSSVLMSLWSVYEKSSVMLTDSFFKHLGSGKTKLQALAEARAEIRRSGFEHPFFWAAFVLVGEAD